MVAKLLLIAAELAEARAISNLRSLSSFANFSFRVNSGVLVLVETVVVLTPRTLGVFWLVVSFTGKTVSSKIFLPIDASTLALVSGPNWPVVLMPAFA